MAVGTMAACGEDARPIVLVVEDDEFIRLEVVERLQRSGFAAVQAGCAEEAIRLLETTVVDLVFSDVEMPGRMDGRGLVGWLRREHPHIPALLASGAGARRDDDPPFLTKPYAPAELIALIRDLLSRSSR
jgi:DNA-binding response OmpR family regulator